ncbi:MAG TPA: hypothetical protein VIR03_03570, partial [Candidatus Saccharimonadales bacterium]
MPKENTPKKQAESEGGSAPELPHAVAKQYGLHHDHDAPALKQQPDDAPKAAPSAKAAAAEPAKHSDDTPQGVQPVDASDADISVSQTDTEKVIEDTKTDQAVDDILSKEGDALLDMQDGLALHGQVPVVPKKRGFWRSIG